MLTPIVSSVYQELVEYLAQLATPEQILAFKVSDTMQERAEELLDRNSDDDLPPAEAAELEQMLAFDRLVSLLKAKALDALE